MNEIGCAWSVVFYMSNCELGSDTWCGYFQDLWVELSHENVD